MSEIANKILDPTHTRANVKAVIAQLEECHARGVPVPSQLAEALPHVVARLMKSDTPRIQAAGGKLLMAMLRHNLELAQVADKMARLDAGLATERVDTPVRFIVGTDGSGV